MTFSIDIMDVKHCGVNIMLLLKSIIFDVDPVANIFWHIACIRILRITYSAESDHHLYRLYILTTGWIIVRRFENDDGRSITKQVQLWKRWKQ